MRKHVLPALLFSLAAAAPAWALDGKWTPGQVLEISPKWLKQQGLMLPPSALWDAQRGTGLLSGAVKVGGCSGAFIAETGLVITNHHCLFGVVQEHSSTQRDLITQGFLARTPAEELPGSTLRVEIPKRFTDVTAKVLAAVPAGVTPLQRLQAIEAAQKALVKACQQQASVKCTVSTFDDGVNYTLIETTELRDVRLVYAPSRAIGEYGGEIDNWSWPRHTGDFAIARVWAKDDGTPAERPGSGTKPYKPEFFFPISTEGLKEKDFVMVLGYPGITWRALIAEEMQERRERFFVRREDLFGELIGVMERASAQDPAAKIALADNQKGLANRYKNAQGQIAGLDRNGTVQKQTRDDQAVAEWVEKQLAQPAGKASKYAGALAAREGLRALQAEKNASWERDYLLGLMTLGNESVAGGIPPLPKGLYYAATLAHNAVEQGKPEGERASGFGAGDQTRLKDRMNREQRSYFAAADRQILGVIVRRALALPEGQRIAAIDAVFKGLSAEQVEQRIDAMYAASPLFDPAARERMLGETPETLAARQDPLLDLGIAWNRELRALRERERDWQARAALHRPLWRQAVAAHAGKAVAPDANGSLRVSFGHVQGYAPRDGAYYTPFTHTRGLVEKYTGQEPFNMPAPVLAAARQSPEVRVNFLADLDTSGGNSGSPVIDARGRLVGVNHDRVWENVAGDFGFNPALSRNISVDIRYLLWTLKEVERAQGLLQELGAAGK